MRHAPDGHDPPAPEPVSDPTESNQDLMRETLLQVGALVEYVQHLLAAQADILRLRARGIVSSIVLSVVMHAAAIVIAIASVVYLYRGMAGGFERLFDRAWLGNLVAGLIGPVVIGAALAIKTWRARRQREERLAMRYEQRKSRQRAHYGKDVEQNARVAA